MTGVPTELADIKDATEVTVHLKSGSHLKGVLTGRNARTISMIEINAKHGIHNSYTIHLDGVDLFTVDVPTSQELYNKWPIGQYFAFVSEERDSILEVRQKVSNEQYVRWYDPNANATSVTRKMVDQAWRNHPAREKIIALSHAEGSKRLARLIKERNG